MPPGGTAFNRSGPTSTSEFSKVAEYIIQNPLWTDLLVSDHDLSVGGVDVGRGVVLVDVAAVIVRERVLQPPRRPVLDVDDAPDAEEGEGKRDSHSFSLNLLSFEHLPLCFLVGSIWDVRKEQGKGRGRSTIPQICGQTFSISRYILQPEG